VFHFQLVAQSGSKFEGDVHEVILPTMDGEIGVLSHHMPLVSVVTAGAVAIRKQAKDSDAQREYFATYGGVINVSDNTLRVLVDEADNADDINETEVQLAMERAKDMKTQAKDEVSLERAQALVDRASVRLQVAGLKRRHHQR
jgi:F-type H+-transporting ATPase subunit epsilon